MLDQSTRQFYADRRERGMTDAMIVNELEASGWTMVDAKAAVATAQATYVPSPSVGMLKTDDAIEYDVPAEYHKQNKRKYLLALFSAVPAILLEVFTDSDDGSVWLGLVIATVVFLVCVPLFWYKMGRTGPKRIRLDMDGYTILEPKQKLQRWAKFKSYSFGEEQKKQTWLRFWQPPEPIPEFPTVTLQPKASFFMTTAEERTPVQIPFPPQERAVVEKFLQRAFAHAATQVTPKQGWQHNPWIIVGLFFGIPGIITLIVVLIMLS